MSTKRELVLKTFHNEKADRIPVGFWHHFLDGEDFNAALERPELVQENLEGHRKFKEEIEEYVEGLLASVGREGVIIGADCTVPADIDVQRLQWVRDKAAAL